jgi:hypothetical protein
MHLCPDFPFQSSWGIINLASKDVKDLALLRKLVPGPNFRNSSFAKQNLGLITGRLFFLKVQSFSKVGDGFEQPLI